MTRENLADHVGISIIFCANLEYGNKMMSMKTLNIPSVVLGVSTDFLMDKTTDNVRIQNIVLILKGQPEQVIVLAEKKAQLCIHDHPREK